MIWDVGPGLAAVLGALVGGAVSFLATWWEAESKRRDDAEQRRAAAELAIQEERNRANSDLISAGR